MLCQQLSYGKSGIVQNGNSPQIKLQTAVGGADRKLEDNRDFGLTIGGTTMTAHLETVRASLQQLLPVSEELTKRFLTNLFDREPSLESILLGVNFPTIEHAMRKALVMILSNIDNPDFLESYLFEVGKKHRALGVEPQHLPLAMDALVYAVRETSGPYWTLELEEGWTDAAVMLLGYMQSGLRAAPVSPQSGVMNPQSDFTPTR